MHPLQSPLNPIDLNVSPPSPHPLSSTSSLSPGQENVNPQLEILSKRLSEAPLAVKEAVELAVSYFTDARNASPRLQLTPPPDITGPPVIPSNTIVHCNIQINRQTTLETVYYYPLNTLMEYPETSVDGSVGHVFTLDPQEWINPMANFAYSLGGSHGMSQKAKIIKVSLLVDASGERVPCRETHTTCTRPITLFVFRPLIFE
jgi:hypothetical protein